MRPLRLTPGKHRAVDTGSDCAPLSWPDESTIGCSKQLRGRMRGAAAECRETDAHADNPGWRGRMTEAKAGNTPLKFARSLLGPRVIGSGKNGRNLSPP